jgi:hypothetical protein
MTFDLACIPADLLGTSPDLKQDDDRDQPSKPDDGPARELAPETTPPSAQSVNTLPSSVSSPLSQESPVGTQTTVTIYPNDQFIHALYGGFMGMADLPGALPNEERWAAFLAAYANPNFSHYFDGVELPSA